MQSNDETQQFVLANEIRFGSFQCVDDKQMNSDMDIEGPKEKEKEKEKEQKEEREERERGKRNGYVRQNIKELVWEKRLDAAKAKNVKLKERLDAQVQTWKLLAPYRNGMKCLFCQEPALVLTMFPCGVHSACFHCIHVYVQTKFTVVDRKKERYEKEKEHDHPNEKEKEKEKENEGDELGVDIQFGAACPCCAFPLCVSDTLQECKQPATDLLDIHHLCLKRRSVGCFYCKQKWGVFRDQDQNEQQNEDVSINEEEKNNIVILRAPRPIQKEKQKEDQDRNRKEGEANIIIRKMTLEGEPHQSHEPFQKKNNDESFMEDEHNDEIGGSVLVCSPDSFSAFEPPSFLSVAQLINIDAHIKRCEKRQGKCPRLHCKHPAYFIKDGYKEHLKTTCTGYKCDECGVSSLLWAEWRQHIKNHRATSEALKHEQALDTLTAIMLLLDARCSSPSSSSSSSSSSPSQPPSELQNQNQLSELHKHVLRLHLKNIKMWLSLPTNSSAFQNLLVLHHRMSHHIMNAIFRENELQNLQTVQDSALLHTVEQAVARSKPESNTHIKDRFLRIVYH